jgi:transcriptional regulator with XRE-family HTH domain
MTIDQIVGKRIRDRRKKLGLSQEQFALKAKINRSYISMVEQGRKSLTIKTLNNIRKALKVEFSYFFSSIGSEANS